MSEPFRTRAFFGARVVLTAVMLALVLPRLDAGSLFPDRQLQTLLWISGAVVVAGVAIVLSAVRWQQMLHALELPTELAPLLSHSLAALFVSNFLPTTVGGDVLRATRLSAQNRHRKVSAASVILERLTGFVGLPLITLAGLLLNPDLLRLGAVTNLALAVSLGTLLVVMMLLVVAANLSLGARLGARLGSRRWLSLAVTVHVGLVRLKRHPALAVTVMVAALAYQLTIVLVTWMAAHALGISVGWTAMMALVPVVAIAQALPLSIGGLGLREGSLVLVLGPLGVAASSAVALGLLMYAINMGISLLGAPAFLVGARRFVPTTV